MGSTIFGGEAPPYSGAMRLPEPQYVYVDGDAIAWYSIGDGPETVVGTAGLFASVESTIESPGAVRLIERMSQFRRVMLFDHRTTGMSDAFSADREPTVEDWAADIAAVIEASGRTSVDLFGIGVASIATIAAAATLADRIRSLTTICGCPKLIAAEDYPQGMTTETFDLWTAAVTGGIDAPELARTVLPSTVEAERTFLRRAGQQGARPRAARQLLKALATTDARADLERITCPSLLIHAERDNFISSDCSRFMAERIPSSRLELLPTDDHVVVITMPDEVADLIETFLTGRATEPASKRRLVTVLSTDIVDSTRRAAGMGDTAWRHAITTFEEGSRSRIDLAGGSTVKFTGDGHLAIFDSPGAALGVGRDLVAFAASIDLPIRVGLHAGEVEIYDTDVLGVAVVIATRVMGAGGADDVIVTSTIVDLVDGAGHRWESIGTHELKGIERPRALWRLQTP